MHIANPPLTRALTNRCYKIIFKYYITGLGGGLGLWATTLEILHGGNLNAGRFSISLRSITSPLEGLDAQNERKGPAAAQS